MPGTLGKSAHALFVAHINRTAAAMASRSVVIRCRKTPSKREGRGHGRGVNIGMVYPSEGLGPLGVRVGNATSPVSVE